MIRIGHNPNTNMLPLFHFLPKDFPWLEWVTAEPTGHNSLLARGQIDLAPISLFSYGEYWREYYVFPDLSVSVKGRVGSILLFSKFPLSNLDGKIIALTNNSATSINLTKIVLQIFYGHTPIYKPMSAELPAMLEEADAALLIGDQAIQAAANNAGYWIYDLGEEWFRHTGLAMTYAVWAFPRNLVLTHESELREAYRLLQSSKHESVANIDQIIKVCLGMVDGSVEFWGQYFSHFSYDLDKELIKGIEHYFDLCTRLRLLPSRPELNFWP